MAKVLHGRMATFDAIHQEVSSNASHAEESTLAPGRIFAMMRRR